MKSDKNDFLDAEAIAEAVDRQNMRFVLIKTDDQLDLQALHSVRDRLIARRTAVINQLRAFLLERGMTFAKTPAKLKVAMSEILEDADSNECRSTWSSQRRATSYPASSGRFYRADKTIARR